MLKYKAVITHDHIEKIKVTEVFAYYRDSRSLLKL